MPVKLIAHALIEKDGKYLLIKRSKIKRGSPNMYPEYWDIPGGSVEEDELPREGTVREVMEEVNQKVQLSSILHEDSYPFDEFREEAAEFYREFYGVEIDPALITR